MSTVTNKVSLDISYTDTDFNRRYTMSGVSNAQLANVESICNAINGSLAGGTAGGMSSTFISDDFDGTKGYMKKIEKATIVSTEETTLEL